MDLDPEPDPDSARTRLLAAAGVLFSRRGYEGASTRAIAEHAGVHQALVRYHFGSKDALWREVIERGIAILQTDVTQRAVDGDRAGALLAALAANPEPVQAIVHALLEPGARRDFLVQRLAPLHARSLAWLTAGERTMRGARDEALLCAWLGIAIAPLLFGPAQQAAGGRKLDAHAVQQAQRELLVPWLRGSPLPSAGAWSLSAAHRRRLLSAG